MVRLSCGLSLVLGRYWLSDCWQSKANSLLASSGSIISKEMQNLIYKLSKENPLWSPERVKDTLILLKYDPPCEDTIRKYMYKPRKPRKRSTTWLPFLRNHLDVSWAIDFFTVTTIHFATYYVFLVFDHGRRKVIHFAITRNPFMNWVIQQLRESMPFGVQPKYLFRDKDGIYGNGIGGFLESCRSFLTVVPILPADSPACCVEEILLIRSVPLT